MVSLRPYQADLLSRTSAEFKRGRRSVLIQSATGSGKTSIAITAARLAAERGKRVLFQAHTRPLVDQTVEKFHGSGIDVGVLMAGRSGNNLPIQVGSVQTISRRLDRIQPFDLIITDECRRATSKVYRVILSAWPGVYHIGLDATPCRADGRGLDDIYETMVCGPSVKQLIADGYLAPFSVFAPNPVDTSGVHMRGGDFDQGEIAELMDRSVLIGDCVDHYKRLAGDRQALTYCTNIRHAEHVHAAFLDAGVPSSILHSEMDPGEQAMAINDIRSGSVRNLISVGMVNDGFDVPNVSCAILLRPTASLSLACQQWGRCNRGANGPTAIVLDHAGNVLRHGLPDNEREWTLEGRKSGARKLITRDVSIRHCRKCFAVYLSDLPECPHCGASADKSSRHIEERDGELVEVSERMRQIEAAKAAKAAREEELRSLPYKAALAQCETPDHIKELAAARGYKPSWSIITVSDRWGVSPERAAILLGYSPRAAHYARRMRGHAA